MGDVPEYGLAFTTPAWNDFANIDCPELRAMLEPLRENPFPDPTGLKRRVPEPSAPPHTYWTFSTPDAQGVYFKAVYTVEFDPVSEVPIQIVVSTCKANRLPLI